jgi:hypothetical protein
LVLGYDRAKAKTILARFDGNLRRVFAELSIDRSE